MLVDGGLGQETSVSEIIEAAKRHEAQGYDGIWSAETSHDPFLPLLLAAEHTSRIELGTSIAVAFARSPMTLANTANDLHKYSNGRFILGLGSQIKPHITKRFSMEWSKPADRMREMILAIRAIWATWNEGEKLEFRGEFYTHTLMTPFFDPGPNPFGTPKIFLAGVGPRMTQVAGEVADGFICHGFTTEKYLREVTIPALNEGRAKANKGPVSESDDFEIVGPSFVVTGEDEADHARAAFATRRQISFYGSTPAYRSVLELHGWGDLQSSLNKMSKNGQWNQMADLIDDEVLNTFAVVGEPAAIAPELDRRYGDIVARVSFYSPYDSNQDRWAEVMADLKSAGGSQTA